MQLPNPEGREILQTPLRRAERAHVSATMGELSSARFALEGEAVAPGDQATLGSLRDRRRRPEPREPIPQEILDHRPRAPFSLGWSGGIRGIVVGEILRRLVARTMAQSLGSALKTATAPHQYALISRSGCESIAHALQGLADLDPEATVMSVDGVGAFDLISRASMMSALRSAP